MFLRRTGANASGRGARPGDRCPGSSASRAFAGMFHRLLRSHRSRGRSRGDRSLATRVEQGACSAGVQSGPVAIVEIASWRALIRLAMGGSAGWYVALVARRMAQPRSGAAVRPVHAQPPPARRSGPVAKGRMRAVRRLWHVLRRNHRAGRGGTSNSITTWATTSTACGSIRAVKLSFCGRYKSRIGSKSNASHVQCSIRKASEFLTLNDMQLVFTHLRHQCIFLGT